MCFVCVETIQRCIADNAVVVRFRWSLGGCALDGYAIKRLSPIFLHLLYGYLTLDRGPLPPGVHPGRMDSLVAPNTTTVVLGVVSPPSIDLTHCAVGSAASPVRGDSAPRGRPSPAGGVGPEIGATWTEGALQTPCSRARRCRANWPGNVLIKPSTGRMGPIAFIL